MTAFRRFILLILIPVFIYCFVPAILLLTGVYSFDSFFYSPPSAKLTALHCDHRIKGKNGFDGMRLTSVISTHNMAGKYLKVKVKFVYEDGTPVLSAIDNAPIEITKRIKADSDDSPLTVVLHARYKLIPDESANKSIECRYFLSCPDSDNKNVSEEQEQSIKNVFKWNND